MKNSEKLHGTKTFRELLFKGCDKRLVNAAGKSPIDYIHQVKNLMLKQELENILGNPKCQMSCLTLVQPIMDADRSNKTMLVFLGIMLVSFLMITLFVMPCQGIVHLQWVFTVIYFVAMIMFFVSSFKDPGYVTKSSEISFLRLNQYFDPSYLCPTCEVLKPQESRHCYICNRDVTTGKC